MEDVAKRREARRRKILENSENRLNKITGIEQKSTRAPVCLENNGHANTEAITNANCVTNENVINEVPPQSNTTTVIQSKPPQKQYRKTVISALAVFISILPLIVHKFQYDSRSLYINKIFLPLLLYEVGELFYTQKKKNEKNVIYLLLAASAKNTYILTVIKYLELVTNILQDVMIYFFVFVCCEFVKYLILVKS